MRFEPLFLYTPVQVHIALCVEIDVETDFHAVRSDKQLPVLEFLQ
jgi:hypothetical protein